MHGNMNVKFFILIFKIIVFFLNNLKACFILVKSFEVL